MAKIDWIAAKKDYLTDPKLSYADIAEKYKITERQVARVSSKNHWVEERQKMSAVIQDKVMEKAGDKIAAFQARKLEVGMFMVGKGAEGLTRQNPKTARESKELVETGYKLASEAMGVDKPGTQINIQQNFLSITDFISDIVKRRENNGE